MASTGKRARRVLILVENLPVPFDRRVWLEATALSRAGYGVSVISPKGTRRDMASYELIDGIHIYRYRAPLNAHGPLSYLWEFCYCLVMTFLLSLRVARRHGIDVVHACNPPDTFFVIGVFYKLFGKRFIFDHHDLSPEMYQAKYEGEGSAILLRALLLLERLTFRAADVVITTNESHKRIAIGRGNVPPERVFVVRSGPDFDRLRILPPEQALKRARPHLACYLGEMCPQDGVQYLLRAIAHLVFQLGETRCSFTLVGGGEALPSLRALATQLRLDEYVHFTGRVSDHDLCRYLSTADLCLDPDPKNGWTDKSTMNKVTEYMAFAKPLVAFDLHETRVSARDAAVYVTPNSVPGFAHAMASLLDDPARRGAMGCSGRQRVEQALLWRYSEPALLRAYARVFDAGGIQPWSSRT